MQHVGGVIIALRDDALLVFAHFTGGGTHGGHSRHIDPLVG